MAQEANEPKRLMLEHALAYAARGWRVFPLHNMTPGGRCSCGKPCEKTRGKHPRTRNGLLDASLDDKQIRAWWGQWPYANIGIATGEESGIVVIDVDTANGKKGLDSLARLGDALGDDLPATFKVRTGSGGYHLYFQHPSVRIQNQDGGVGMMKDYPDLDVRGDGGYVVAPPSNHASGNRYVWEYMPDGMLPALLPDSFLDFLTTRPDARSRLPEDGGQPLITSDDAGAYWVRYYLRQASPGNRNHCGFLLACQLRDSGLDELNAERYMLDYAAQVGSDGDPYTEAEARTSLRSAYKRVAREPARRSHSGLASMPVGDDSTYPYLETATGFAVLRTVKEMEVMQPISNFTARIVADMVEDDGSGEVRRVYDVVARHKGRERRFSLTASQLDNLSWVSDKLGASATVLAQQSCKEHTRVAIHLFSSDVAEQQVYTHVGWRELADGRWAYLHTGGAIVGQNETPPSATVKLEKGLAGYEFPAVTTRERLAHAVKRFMRVLTLAPDKVMLPLFAAAWRAPLGDCDFSLFLSGQSGQKKSEIAALIQQSFGARFNSRNFPDTWESTPNMLELSAFRAKDAILVIDEFKPKGTHQDVQRYHLKADQILRSAGNLAGKGRLGPNLEARAVRKPRALIIATGEDVPMSGTDSLAARLISLKMPLGAVVNDALLTEAQADAAAGLYAEAMAGYLTYLAPHYGEIHDRLFREVAHWRDRLQFGAHARTAPNLANLAIGLEYFLDYAQAVEALTAEEADQLRARFQRVMRELSNDQKVEQNHANPVEAYADLLRTALSTGRAFLLPTDESWNSEAAKPSMKLWGWIDTGPRLGAEMIGWLDYDTGDLYLEPGAAYGVAQEMARKQGTAFTTSKMVIHRFLAENKLSMRRESDAARQSNLARISINKTQHSVVWVRASFIYPDMGDEIPRQEDASEKETPPAPVLLKHETEATPASIVQSLMPDVMEDDPTVRAGDVQSATYAAYASPAPDVQHGHLAPTLDPLYPYVGEQPPQATTVCRQCGKWVWFLSPPELPGYLVCKHCHPPATWKILARERRIEGA